MNVGDLTNEPGRLIPVRSPFGAADLQALPAVVQREELVMVSLADCDPLSGPSDAARWRREAEAEVDALCPVLHDPEVALAAHEQILAHHLRVQAREAAVGGVVFGTILAGLTLAVSHAPLFSVLCGAVAALLRIHVEPVNG